MHEPSESFVARFLRLESAGGILLIGAALLALLAANTPLRPYYAMLLDTPVEIRIGALQLAKPLLLWINDGLMAVFFFLVGLELKRELMEGELASIRKIALPAFGAVGGMLVPAVIYLYFNLDDPDALKGWAIPVATDIAFALGILSLLGSRVPTAIKVFLTSLAIFDDIGAVIIIAAFYTAKISVTALGVVAICLLVLTWLNRRHPESTSAFLAVGLVMWVAMLKSGVHATLAGVVLAMFIPLRSRSDRAESPLQSLEQDLHGVVAFFVLPLFAFANAGLDLSGIGPGELMHPVPQGIALGLFLGKPLGVFGFCWLSVRLGLAGLPRDVSWGALFGTAILCGIGFTMSLFIGSLAFEETGVNRVFQDRLGILTGSLASALAGYVFLQAALGAARRA